LHSLIRRVTEAYEDYDVPNATRPVQAFVERLSNWYLRLSRRRFWKSEDDTDKRSAYATLNECMVTVAHLLAPSMPFLSEAMYRDLVLAVDPSAPPSVHLSVWPTYDESLIDHKQMETMALAQRLVSLGRAARESANLRVRQPLAEALFAVRHEAEKTAIAEVSDLLASELNVKIITVLEGTGDVVSYRLNPLPRLLGKKFGKDFPRVQNALREGSPEDVTAWAQTLLAGEAITLTLDGQACEVTPEECEVQQVATEGYAIAEEAGYLAAIDTTLSEELVLEGLAREVVRRIQIMRKDADFAINDRIVVAYQASDRLAQAITAHAAYIAGETLADALEASAPPDDSHHQEFSIDGETITLSVKQAS
jgi:isoleucyl-tRNA synthetase